jgi:thiaminase/transcriptional activator TenA
MVATDSADDLKQYHIKYWNDLLNHRFILEMGNSSLPIEKFTFYLIQDHVFLKEFCSFLLIARQKSNDQQLKNWFDSLYQTTIDSEMQMQRELLSSLGGISNIDNISAISVSSATVNYISFLKEVSSLSSSPSSAAGNVEVMVSAMAPCPWSYLEISQKLSKSDIKNGVYSKWIQFYSSNESRQQIDELKNILSSLYDQTNDNTKMIMRQHFGAACKHEYNFWESAYKMG